MQGDFTIYPQKLKGAVDEYQTMYELLNNAASKILEIRSELDGHSYDEIKQTLLHIYDSIISDADTIKQFQNILQNCISEYTYTEDKLYQAASLLESSNTDNSLGTAFDRIDNEDSPEKTLNGLLPNLLSYSGAFNMLTEDSAPVLNDFLETALGYDSEHNFGYNLGHNAADIVLDSPFNQESFYSDIAEHGLAAAVKTELFPTIPSSEDVSASDTFKGYIQDGFLEDTSADSPAFTPDNTANADALYSADSSDGSGSASGGSGSGSGGSSGNIPSGNAIGNGISAGNGAAAKWVGGSPVPTTAKGLENFGAYSAKRPSTGSIDAKTAAVPKAETAGTPTKSSPASIFSSKAAGPSILAVAALGTLGVIGAGWAHKSKTKGQEPCLQ